VALSGALIWRISIVTEGTVKLDFDDLYVGQIQEVVIEGKKVSMPNGYGTLTSESGGHKFRGEFENRLRQGNGILETAQFKLYSSWNLNRPATSRARIEYLATGDTYMGHLAAETKPHHDHSTSTNKSKFTQWLRSTEFLRELWGEMIYGNGDAYYGQWHHNDRHGFGVQVYRDGSRYCGNWSKGQRNGMGVMLYQNGVMYEGQWRKDERETGALLCPSGLDMRATWKSQDGGGAFKAVICGEQRTMAGIAMGHAMDIKQPMKRVSGCAVPNTWQSLLDLHRALIDTEKLKVSATYHKLASEMKGAEAVKTFLRTFLQETVSSQARHPLAAAAAIFKRVFFFLYGTCGSAREIAAGTQTVKQRNSLSWCSLKKHHGGCYHRSRGLIQPYHAHCAIDDVLSFSEEALSIIRELLGPAMSKLIDDHHLTPFLSSAFLDFFLPEIFTPLFNVYQQVYREEELLMQRTYRRLANVTLDDLGVSYARSAVEETLFSPYSDPISILQTIDTSCNTLGSLCRAVTDWSIEIERQSRTYQIKVHSAQDFERITAAYVTSGSFAGSVKGDPAGADDLFPIALYTFLAAKVPHVVSVAAFLSDMSAEENYYDAHGSHSFSLAMLNACISHAGELYKDLRENQVMVPTSLFHQRVRQSYFPLKNDVRSSADLDWVVTVLNDVAAASSSCKSVKCGVQWRQVNPQGEVVLRSLNIQVFHPECTGGVELSPSEDSLSPKTEEQASLLESSHGSAHEKLFEERVDPMQAVVVIPQPRYPNFLYREVADHFFMTLHQ